MFQFLKVVWVAVGGKGVPKEWRFCKKTRLAPQMGTPKWATGPPQPGNLLHHSSKGESLLARWKLPSHMRWSWKWHSISMLYASTTHVSCPHSVGGRDTDTGTRSWDHWGTVSECPLPARGHSVLNKVDGPTGTGLLLVECNVLLLLSRRTAFLLRFFLCLWWFPRTHPWDDILFRNSFSRRLFEGKDVRLVLSWRFITQLLILAVDHFMCLLMESWRLTFVCLKGLKMRWGGERHAWSTSGSRVL